MAPFRGRLAVDLLTLAGLLVVAIPSRSRHLIQPFTAVLTADRVSQGLEFISSLSTVSHPVATAVFVSAVSGRERERERERP